MKSLVIAAPHSGSGKTTVTLGLMAALKRRGLTVAPFKVGPDFIDPGYHRLATGTASVNLDGWMCPPDFVRATYRHHTAGADIAVVEGVMGLFDGIDGVSDAGSTAQVAKLLGSPVVLVVDARSQARSAAALVHGFSSFDAGVQVAAVVFNNVASENHERLLRESMAASLPDIAVVGCMPKDASLAIPSRHLGLVTADDNPLSAEFLTHSADTVERHLDLDALLNLDSSSTLNSNSPPSPRVRGLGGGGRCHSLHSFRLHPPPQPPPIEGGGDLTGSLTPTPLPEGEGLKTPVRGGLSLTSLDRAGIGVVKIAVARDAAFCFVYEDNLRLLREEGAELCFFSPLADAAIPEEVAGIYLPGGYPELFAETLAGNRSMKESLRAVVEGGMPVYAECGGFIYLTRGVSTDGGAHPFVGIFPVETRMLPRRKALGYRQVELAGSAVIGEMSAVARGHEFHYSEMEEMPSSVERVYTVTRKGAVLGQEGFRYKNCLASYIHLHFGSSPGIAETFVGHCGKYLTGSHHEDTA